jgi:hypothetical protein
MVSRDGTPALIVIRKLHRMGYALESSMPWWPIRSLGRTREISIVTAEARLVGTLVDHGRPHM